MRETNRQTKLGNALPQFAEAVKKLGEFMTFVLTLYNKHAIYVLFLDYFHCFSYL